MTNQRLRNFAWTALFLAFGPIFFVFMVWIRSVDETPATFEPYDEDPPSEDAVAVPDGGMIPAVDYRPSGGEERARGVESGRRQASDETPGEDTLNRTGPEPGATNRPRRGAEQTATKGVEENPSPGTLSRENIKEGIEAVRPLVKACYEDALHEFPDAAGQVTLAFRVIAEGGEGRVELSELEDEKTTLFDEKLHECMMLSIGEATFDVPGGGGVVNVTYPFHFENDPSREAE